MTQFNLCKNFIFQLININHMVKMAYYWGGHPFSLEGQNLDQKIFNGQLLDVLNELLQLSLGKLGFLVFDSGRI